MTELFQISAVSNDCVLKLCREDSMFSAISPAVSD